LSIKPEFFDYLKHFGATQTLDVYRNSSGPAIALRHDVDYSLDTALEMAYWEAESGIRATYFLLHTTRYWGTDRFTEKCAQLLAFGHEIGLHTNLIPAWYCDGVAPQDTLKTLLECLREAGAEVHGSSAHGDPLCYKNGFINYWIFSELRPDDPGARESVLNAEGLRESDPKRRVGYPAQHTLQSQQGKYPLWAVSMRDYGIEYEASHLESDACFSDSGGSWKRTADPLTCDLSDSRCQVLMHPIHWRGDPKVYFFLSTARSGSKWLAQMLDSATPCRGVHEYTLNHRNNEKVGGSPVADKRTGIGLVGFIKDQQEITSRLTHTNDVIAHATCDYAEANVYLPLFLPSLTAQFPDATLVHLHRNPEDVVLSVMKRGWYDTPDDDRHPRFETIPNWSDLAPLEKCCHYVAETHGVIQQETNLRLSFESMVSDVGYFQDRLRQLGIAYYPVLGRETFWQRINENDIAVNTASEAWNDRERRMYRDICGITARKLDYSLIARSPPGKAWRMLRDRIDVGWQRIIRWFSKPSVELLAAEDSGVMVKSGVQKHESGGGLVELCHLDPIFEFDPDHQLRKVIETA
jgi:hypothetical protein